MTPKISTAHALKKSTFKSLLESVPGAKVHPLLKSVTSPSTSNSKRSTCRQRIKELETENEMLRGEWTEERRQLRMISEQLLDCTFPVTAGHAEAVRWLKDILNLDGGLA